jgi:methylthioribose-1-phosphate isomerase
MPQSEQFDRRPTFARAWVMAFDAPSGPLPRTVDWKGDHAVIIDQTKLPGELVMLQIRSVDEMISAIQRLAVRGAPAIGVAGALGVALAAQAAEREGHDLAWLAHEADRIATARPTAVNLSWAVNQLRPILADGLEAIASAAVALLNDDIRAGRALGERGADLIAELCAVPVRVQTHCNAGGLACVEIGSALGIVRVLHERGHLVRVHVDETRPLLQGSRLTAYELAAMGIDHRIQVDGAGPSAIKLGLVDCVIIGADRVAANGDTANKVGSYPLALAAKRAGVPFIVASPEATIDDATASGEDIHIEERNAAEVLNFCGVQVSPNGSQVWNPAFDVTPADLITAIVTERRVIRPNG